MTFSYPGDVQYKTVSANISNMRCYVYKPACVVLCLELMGSSALCFGTEWAPTSLRQLLVVTIHYWACFTGPDP